MPNRSIFLVLSTLLLLSGCQSDDKSSPDYVDSCGGEDFADPVFDIADMSVRVFNSNEMYIAASPIDYQQLKFAIVSDPQFMAKKRSSWDEMNFSLFPSAHACSPLPPYSNENIVSLEVSSNYNFNDELIAGENLNSVFDVVYSDSSEYRTYAEGRQYLSLEDYLAQPEVNAGMIIEITLNQAPQYFAEQSFSIQIELDSGEKFQLETPVIDLTDIQE